MTPARLSPPRPRTHAPCTLGVHPGAHSGAPHTVCLDHGQPAAGSAPSIGLLSTYPPTRCGLATFTAALLAHLSVTPGDVGVVRVLDEPGTSADPEVVGHLVRGSAGSARDAAQLLNGYDAVVLQHEYGIFGGPDGADVLDVVAQLQVPLVTVFHTVLEHPTAHQRSVLERLVAATDVAVTMTETARRRLVGLYGADPDATTVVPHGAVDPSTTVPTPRTVDVRPDDGRPLVLTWGLIGPGKGVEWAVDAVAGLRDLHPRYLVVGRTHPKVLERDGESYREGLQARVAELGAQDLVELDASYLTPGELVALALSADVVLLPYDSLEQVTSGVLIEAVAAGRPVVSTAFPHAVELLSSGAGLVVPQRDPAALEAALRRVLTEPGLADEMAESASRSAPALFWSSVADRYRRIAAVLAADRADLEAAPAS